jgi:response regulator of citrate/malate metabolism
METINYYPPPVRSLIIDDEIDICTLLGNILNRRNIQNEYANSIRDSRERLKDHNFDFIFLDNYLPDGKGIDFIPYLKAAFPNLKIILITALVEQGTMDQMKQDGIDCYLPKPLHTESINDAIDDLLSRGACRGAGTN